MLNLADSMSASADNNLLNVLKKHLQNQVKILDPSTIENFKNGLGNSVMEFSETTNLLTIMISIARYRPIVSTILQYKKSNTRVVRKVLAG